MQEPKDPFHKVIVEETAAMLNEQKIKKILT